MGIVNMYQIDILSKGYKQGDFKKMNLRRKIKKITFLTFSWQLLYADVFFLKDLVPFKASSKNLMNHQERAW